MPLRPGMLDLTAKYRLDEGEFFFSGVQALVRVPLEQLRADRAAGHRVAGFVSGYQGSPLGGFDRELATIADLLRTVDLVHTPGINEELAATSVMGSQIAATFPTARFEGVLGVWYGKAPGLDRAGDAIRHANYAGTSALGGVLALTGDDPACKSSTLPSSSEAGLADLHLPVLVPGNVREILDFGRHAVALSRSCGLWAGFKIVTAVADGTGTCEVDPTRIAPVIPRLDYRGAPYRARVEGNFVAASTDIEREIYEARLPLARLYAAANPALNQVTIDPDDAWLGIVASGRTYYEVVEALGALGLREADLRRRGVRLLRLGMIHPLDPAVVRRFARGLEEIVVVEEKRPYLETAMRDVLYGTTDQPRVVGKFDPDGCPLVAHHGQLDADALAVPLRARLGRRIDLAAMAPVAPEPRQLIPVGASRTPFFCSGCPHNTSTQVPDGALVGAGIGCHGMTTLMDPARVGHITGMTQMGGEGAQWIGIEPFVGATHLIQNLGDGTFFHSGSLAVRAAIAAGSNITYKILYNGAVAMTGGQDAAGAIAVPELAASLLVQGVRRVIVTTDETDRYRGVRLHAGAEVWPRHRIIEAQETLAKVPGVTVLIHDQQCAAEKRRNRKRGNVVEPAMRIVINERVCEGCGDCGSTSNCLSVQPVETEFGRKTRIDQSSCNKDYSCLQGDCPSFLTVLPVDRKRAAVDPAKARRDGGGRRRPALAASELREPAPIDATRDVTVRMPGIGGTGVVTVNQILGTAAMLDGRFVAGLDQTGLSQKAGPVVSDLRISRTPLTGASKVVAGEVDTYLVFDLLVGLAPANLAGATAGRTVAVVSTSRTPTGKMVTDPHASFPDVGPLLAELDAATAGERNAHVDAAAVAAGLFGETTTANVLLLGVAYQLGCLPIAAGAVEQAIELNGAAVEANTLAFRWGRMWVQDRNRVEAAMAVTDLGVDAPGPRDVRLIGDLDQGELGRLLRLRVPDLVAYQHRAYAERYLDAVRRVARAEASAVPGATVLTETVARNLHKLMAYKDEYEVARLHRLASERARVTNDVGGDVRISFNLHPPTLRAAGLKRKLRLGPWFAPALGALARGKRLRGGPFDPFGRAEVRRVERALIDEYVATVDALLPRLTPANHADAVALAALPDLVRGYEHIKLANVARYRSELAGARSRLGL